MALYDGVNGVAREVKKKYDGVNGVAREVTKAYDGVDNVARQYFSSDAVWSKYSCTKKSTYTDNPTSSEIGTIKTESDRSLSYGQYGHIGTTYYFEVASGYRIRTPLSYKLSAETTLEDLRTEWIGNYIVIGDFTAIGRVTAVNSITHYSSGLHIGFTFEIVAKAYARESYIQGSTSYGTLTVEDGELPEEGTLIEGSFDEGYCVLQIDGTYYYYILEE